MVSSTTRERVVLPVVSSAVYTLGFPFMMHFLRRGEWSACFVVIPIFLIACRGGEWMGLIAAGVAIVYTDAILAAQHVIIHHESVSSSRVLPLVLCELTLLLLAPIAGRIGRVVRALRSSSALPEARQAVSPTIVDVDASIEESLAARETRGKHEGCPGEEQSGTETILLVEDEEQVSSLIQRCLSSCGYQVLPAGDGKTGLEICRQKSGQIHLLLVDVSLPDIRGDKVAQEFRATNPHGRVVFMTGYVEVDGLTKERVLNKPFTLSDLAASIRQELDSR